MPSKIQLDENLWFLYICLQKSDMKSIDFTAVGASTNLKPPAARMRYTRLRRQIESGTLIGTHGTPFTGITEKITEASSKRKRYSPPRKKNVDDEGEEMADRKIRMIREKGAVIKEEQESEFESSDVSSAEDSEDEMPLAKLRKARLYQFLGPPPTTASSGQHMKHNEVSRGGGSSIAVDPANFVFSSAFAHGTRGIIKSKEMQGYGQVVPDFEVEAARYR